MDSLVLPALHPSQQLFGWGPDKPSDVALPEMCEELRILEILPLGPVRVQVPPGLADAPDSALVQNAPSQGCTLPVYPRPGRLGRQFSRKGLRD